MRKSGSPESSHRTGGNDNAGGGGEEPGADGKDDMRKKISRKRVLAIADLEPGNGGAE